MIIYFIFPIILLILMLLNPKNKKVKIFCYICLSLFVGTSYFSGSDWRAYEVMYQNVLSDSFVDFSREKGFYIYMYIFKKLGIEFFHFFIITKMLILYVFYMFLKMSNNFYLVTFLFYYQISLKAFIDCPFRNLIAVGIVLIGILQLKKGKKIVFLLLIFLASAFHLTAIFFVLLIFHKIIYKINEKLLLVSVLIIFILLSNYKIILEVLQLFPLSQERLFIFLGKEEAIGRVFTIGNIEKITVIFLMAYLKRLYKNKNHIFDLTIIFFIIYRFATTFNILGRMSLYLEIFYILTVDILLNKFNKKSQCLLITLIFIYGNLSIYKNILPTYKYVPYTSYLTYIFRKKPDYNYRSEYNYKKFYERTGERIGDFLK